MHDTIIFEVYRVEQLEFNGDLFIVQFAKRKDAEEYALFARNEPGDKVARAFYSRETAIDFSHSTGHELEDEVYDLLRGELGRNRN